jgi:hypothetical protein
LADSQTPTFDGTSTTPTFGAGHDYIQGLSETVNPADGSVSVRVAIPAPQERGLNLPLYAYIYDTNGQFHLYPNFVPGGSGGYIQLLHYVEVYGTPETALQGEVPSLGLLLIKTTSLHLACRLPAL